MARGTLRVYLGAAPGVGKTFAMLNEGRRRRDRGTDVVVGYVETHGRPRTADQIADLEVIPRRVVAYRGSAFEEMDTAAILRRRPSVVLVDELAHTNVPGAGNVKRWEDVEELLDAGIDVITTMNVQHLESVNDVVEQITGVEQHETVPDEVVRAAEQIELVDMTPEALRRRMAHGNIYAPDKVDAALTNYFRVGNLGALRELALLWVADQVDVALEDYRERHGIREQWETRERIVVALTGAPGTDDLIRRAARIAQRSHGDLLGVHVISQHGLVSDDAGRLDQHRRLLSELGGEYHEVGATDVADALVDFARSENASQIVLGSSRSSTWQTLTRGSVINRVLRNAKHIDVHVISHGTEVGPAPLLPIPRHSASVGPRRLLIGWLLTLIGLPVFSLSLDLLREAIGLPTVLILFLLFVVVVAAIGGIGPAVAAAVAGFLLVNWYFTPPLHTFTISDPENLVALIAYLLTASIVSALVAVSARRSVEAARATAEAATLSSLATSVVDVDPLPELLVHLRNSFSLTGVALLRGSDGSWAVEAGDGDYVDDPGDADDVQAVGPELVLVLSGPGIVTEGRQMLRAFAASLAGALERRALYAQAAHAQSLVEANELRSALLQSVSHDLRTPLAGIKASVNSLRLDDVSWNEAQTSEFLATIESETDRLTNLVENLLDMSRIHGSALAVMLRPVSLEEVVPHAVASLGDRGRSIVVDIAETVPLVEADPALLDRVIVNLADNAVSYGGDEPVRIEAGQVAGRVFVRIIDRGTGIPLEYRESVFQPFQRLDDARPREGAGVGLGLAVARGFTRAMRGEITIEDTPGGGTTMVVELGVSR